MKREEINIEKKKAGKKVNGRTKVTGFSSTKPNTNCTDKEYIFDFALISSGSHDTCVLEEAGSVSEKRYRSALFPLLQRVARESSVRFGSVYVAGARGATPVAGPSYFNFTRAARVRTQHN